MWSNVLPRCIGEMNQYATRMYTDVISESKLCFYKLRTQLMCCCLSSIDSETFLYTLCRFRTVYLRCKEQTLFTVSLETR